jgi:hypothetical protein
VKTPVVAFLVAEGNSMKLFISALLFSGFAFAQDMPYVDSDFGCIDRADAERYVADFHIDVQSFGGMELCDSQVDTKKLFDDLQILERGQFEADGQNKFVKGFVSPGTYYQWMKHETRGVERGQDIPYATAYNSGGHFTMQDGWAKLSTLGRVGTIVHEARHTAGYFHIRCSQGPYQDTSVAGCDTNYSYGGSHAVEMEYYARVAVQGKNFHPVYKKMARLMAIARSNIFFNTPVLQTREGVLALSQDRGHAELYDNGQWYNREVPAVGGRLKRTSFGAVVFDGLKALAVELYKNSGFSDAVTDTYSYYKLVKENEPPVKDFEEFDVGTKRYVVRLTADNKITPYDFPNGTWGRDISLPFTFAKTSTAALGKAQTGLYLISTSGEIYNYQPQNQRITNTGLIWSQEQKEVIVYKGQNLVLMNNGQIMSQSASGLAPWAETRNLYSDLVTTPIYDGFEVTKE